MLNDNLNINVRGHLTFCGRDTLDLAARYGTPAYFMDEEMIRERCRLYRSAMQRAFGGDSHPLYASKALSFKAIYRIMREENMGIDVVSCGEIYTAFAAGYPLENAYFHGSSKTDADIAYAMDKGVGVFVCDNEDELKAIDREAERRGICQGILLRLTPGIDPHTQEKISTGKIDSKFGIGIETGQAAETVGRVLQLRHVNLKGFHCHIGSQTFEYEPFADAAEIMLRFIEDMKRRYGYEAEILNLGGGMGVPYLESQPKIDYMKNIEGIGRLMRAFCERTGIRLPTILMEPGRSMVADAGITLYTVTGTKEIPGYKNYAAVDGGMTDNPRYTLYQADYTVLNAGRMNDTADYTCAIAGRCCESGDLIQENVLLPKPERGDILAVLTTGAYNYSMASNYNRVPRPPVILLTEAEETVAVRRETFEDLVSHDE